MVATPFLIWSSYELYVRWEKGEFGAGKGGLLGQGGRIGSLLGQQGAAGGEGEGRGLNGVEGWGKGDVQANAEQVGIAEMSGEAVLVEAGVRKDSS
jgi:hypothetical protein